LRAAHYFLFFYARQKRKSDFERLLKKVFFFFSLKVGLFLWYSCTLTRYLVDVFFSGIITENKSEENEISLLSLLEKLNLIKFSSSSSLLTFDFCKKRKVSVAQQTRRIFDKSHHKHSKKTDTKFSLSSLSLLPRQQNNFFLYALRRTLVF